MQTKAMQTRTFMGERYAATHQTPGTGVAAGATGFVATTPTLLIYGAVKPIVIAKIFLSQSGTVATNAPNITLALDSANRFSSGGTAFGIVNTSRASSKTSTATALTGATATAAGAGTKYVANYVVPKVVGTFTDLEYPDGLIVPAAGSFLLYTWGGSTNPTWQINVEFIEVP